MENSGILQKIEQIYVLSDICEQRKIKSTASSHSIANMEAIGAYIVLATGIFAALVVLVLEIVVKNTRDSWWKYLFNYLRSNSSNNRNT